MSHTENIAHEETYRGCKIKLIYDSDPQNPREEFDHVGTMVCWHRRYTLGDEQPRCDPDGWFLYFVQGGSRWNEEKERREQEIRARYAKAAEAGFATPEQLEEHEDDLYNELADVESDMEDDDKLLRELFDKDHVRLPLYLYDHSGITMSTGPFGCPWDSGQVGFIYVSMKKAREEWPGTDDEVRAKAIACLKSEVHEYDAYLTGQVVGFEVDDWDGDFIDSCWGFYPDENGDWPDAIQQAKDAIDYHIKTYGERCSLNDGEH